MTTSIARRGQFGAARMAHDRRASAVDSDRTRPFLGMWCWCVPVLVTLGCAASASASDGSSHQRSIREQVEIIKLVVAVVATVLLSTGIWLRRTGQPQAHQGLRDAVLLAVGFAGAIGWWNLFQLRYESGFGHPLDTYHYYVGAKYFDELGYTRLYECTVVAEARSGNPEAMARRVIRNLETYRSESAAELLANPSRCTDHFTAERWEVFVRDVEWFRKRIPEGLWQGLLLDFGYNPTPAWGALASLAIPSGPLTSGRLIPLLLIDPLLLIVMWGVAWKAFGWRSTCVALVFWGTHQPSPYMWTGGAFLRQGWLASFVIGICCLRMRWIATGGFCLSVAALLRVFPVLAIFAIGVRAAIQIMRERKLRIAGDYGRFAIGCALAIATLVPLSLFDAGGVQAWVDFFRNIRFHTSIPFGNNVGLDTFLRYAFGSSGSSLAAHRISLATIVLIYAIAWVRAVSRREPWEVAVFGIASVLLVTSMSNYYLVFLLGFGFLWTRDPAIGAALCALAALTGVAWIWFDKPYAWVSLASVAFVAAATAYAAFAPSHRSSQRDGPAFDVATASR